MKWRKMKPTNANENEWPVNEESRRQFNDETVTNDEGQWQPKKKAINVKYY